MEFIFLLIAIIFIFSLFSSSENRQYTEEDDEDEYEDNFCAPTKYNPANGAPMIGCLDIYGNPYGGATC